MPKPWSEFGPKDWLRLRPLITRYKHGRFLWTYSVTTRQPALAGDTEAVAAAARGGRLLTTIAFNAPDKTALQLRAVRKFVPGAVHLIADNSSSDEAAERLHALARDAGAHYLRLPRGPWTGANAGLSHGLGMTWVWRNIVKRAAPDAFGFLDHDIYPTAPTDPFAPLASYPIAGRVWLKHHPRWHLWAGFCFFRFDAVANLKLNFIRDWFAGLDTGGGNWLPLYRNLDARSVPDPGVRFEAILPGVGIEDCRVEWLGVWLHEQNDWRDLSGTPQRDFMKEKIQAVSDRMRIVLAND